MQLPWKRWCKAKKTASTKVLRPGVQQGYNKEAGYLWRAKEGHSSRESGVEEKGKIQGLPMSLRKGFEQRTA